jgi:hypothetical protein
MRRMGKAERAHQNAILKQMGTGNALCPSYILQLTEAFREVAIAQSISRLPSSGEQCGTIKQHGGITKQHGGTTKQQDCVDCLECVTALPNTPLPMISMRYAMANGTYKKGIPFVARLITYFKVRYSRFNLELQRCSWRSLADHRAS